MPARPVSPPPSAAREFPAWAHFAALVVACIVVYSPALHGALLWDDPGHVTKPSLQSVPGLIRIWFEMGATQQYYPLLHSAFWLEYRLWGDATLGYHLVNVLQHAAATTLAGLCLRRLAIPGAWLAAWLFALHPVAVESVAWITEQKNTLSALFYFAAALAYFRFRENRRPGDYALATAAFLAALFSKTVTATLPAALLVVCWWQRGRLEWRRDVQPLLPWFGLAAVAGWLTTWFERTHIGAVGDGFSLTLPERLLIAGRAPWFYFGKLIWPADLSFIYPRWTLDAGSALQWAFPLAAAAVAGAFLWLALRRGKRGPLAGFLFFGGTLVPALGFINVFPFLYSFVADHFQYLARLGLLALFAAGWAVVSTRWSRAGATALAVAVCTTLGALSWQQAHPYQDPVALWEHTLARNPTAWMAHTNLGIELTQREKPAEAHKHFLAAVALRPDYAEGESNLGDSFTRLGRPQEGLPHLQRALQLRPDFADAQNHLGVALMMLGRSAEGIAAFEHALQLRPAFPRALLNLGLALARQGKTGEALPHFQRAVALTPDDGAAHQQLGLAYALLGQVDAALPELEQAAALQPNSAEIQLARGRVLGLAQRWNAALDALATAAELAPQRPDVRLELAKALRQLGRHEESAEQLRAASELGARAGAPR